ncbi:MAG: flavin reductase [Firmicutes bacterium]|nr:flavin reductase [Bacillota bacterium]
MDPAMFNEAAKTLTYGVYVVTTRLGDSRNALTAVWLTQVTKSPTEVAVSCGNDLHSTAMIRESGVFAVNVLAAGQKTLAYHFGRSSGREVDKFEGIPWEAGMTGSPILRGTAAFLDCRVTNSVETATHTIFIGEAVDGKFFPDLTPAVYRNGKIF